MEKTPITLLNEYCTKQRITLSFTMLPSSDKKEFFYRADVGSAFAIASGSSKKSAKHNSAQKLLLQLNPRNSNYSNGYSPLNQFGNYLPEAIKEASNRVTTNGHENLKNSIVELHELSQQMRWPLPLYEFSSINSPTEPFTCTVRLDSHIKTGIGKSKKLAKLDASSLLLNSLIKKADQDDVKMNENTEIVLNTNSDYLRAVEDCSTLLKESRINVLKPSDSQQIALFYRRLKHKSEKTLASLQSFRLNLPATNYVQILQEVSEEQDFTVIYTDINEKTIDGQRQCTVQLGSIPVAVVHGSGETLDHAKYQAAHNALQYLKIMTRKI